MIKLICEIIVYSFLLIGFVTWTYIMFREYRNDMKELNNGEDGTRYPGPG